MNRVLIITALMLLCGMSLAQIPQWQWAAKANNYYDEYGTSIVTDSTGNSYVAGHFYSTAANPAVFGADSLVSQGGTDIYVAKLDPAGNWLWAIRAGGSSDDTGISLVLDNDGNIYLTGSFSLTTQIGETTLTAAGSYDVYVAKLSGSGTWLWATRAGGTGYDAPECIARDSGGNLYISGYFTSVEGIPASFGATSLTGAGGYDFFISKLDANGNWLWAKRGGSNAAAGDICESVAVDADGNCYATGYFRGTADFGAEQITSSGAPDCFVVKLDASGNWVWVRTVNSSAYGAGKCIAADAAGNCFVTGYFGLNAGFGSQTLTGAGAIDIFAAKLDTDGNWQWATRGGGTLHDYGNNIALDSSGNLHVSGYFYGNAVLGDDTLASAGQTDIFNAKLDAAGNWVWAARAGGTSYDYCYGMSVDNAGSTYLTGTFQGTADFGAHTLVNPAPSGYNDFFVAKQREIAQPLPPQNLALSVSGSDLVLSWDPTSQDTNGQPVTPACYNVYWLDSLTGTYNLAETTSLSWTHTGGALLSPKFYRVTAVAAD